MGSITNICLLKNGEEITIRALAAEDAGKMICYVKTIDGETRFLLREPGEFTLSVEEERNFIQARSDDSRVFWKVAVINEKIIASCSVFGTGKYKRSFHRAQIGISVLKEYWGMGIGRGLMREAIDWCKENGFEQLELEVVANNDRAIALYKSFGFEIQGTRRHASKYPDGTYADEHIMTLFL